MGDLLLSGPEQRRKADPCGEITRFRIGGHDLMLIAEDDWHQSRHRANADSGARLCACGSVRVDGRLHIILSDTPEEPEQEPLASRLTRRELEIAGEIARGAPNKEIARLLGISPLTVREHVRRICAKLNVHSRAAIAGRIGAENGGSGFSPHRPGAASSRHKA